MPLTLLPFQTEDVEKLKSKRSRLIGNEPGTGKTYEGIALDLANRAGDGHPKVEVPQVAKTLIVCPKNALAVWDEHLCDLTNDYVYLYTYNTRHKFLQQAKDPKRGGYFIVNYDSVRISDLEDLRNVDWFHIIGDEIHRIKNRKSQMTIAFKKIPTIYKTGMSGTPADNLPPDLWSTLNWLWPNYYTAFWGFVKAYTEKIELKQTREQAASGRTDGYRKITGVKNLHILHKEMEPWFVRRRKKDVLKDLPDKYYKRIMVDLGPKQRKAYDEMKKTAALWFEENAEELNAKNPLVTMAAIAQLQRLQQLTAGYLVPRIDPATGEQAWHWKWPKYGVDDFLQQYPLKFERLKEYKKKYADDPIAGGATVEWEWDLDDPSAKIDTIMDLLEDRDEDEGIIIFSQSKVAINLLGKRLAAARVPHGLYTGDTKQSARDQLVRDFQEGRVRVFAGTIQAGGEAITLTRSSTVLFIDRWWSPSKNTQAEDRAHRIGQRNAVEIIDLMARNTIDLGRYQSIALKEKWLMQLFGDVVDQDKIIEEIDLSKVLNVDEMMEED